jgi:hypothetical protein
MRCGYIGNFGAPHSTENHVARALECNDVEVVRIQEGQAEWLDIPNVTCDFLLWTTTYDYANRHTYEAQRTMLQRRDVPIVGYHLDRWWGLDREHRIQTSPFFQVDLLCTADGGHQKEWAEAGIDHHWFPPAVSTAECAPGEFREDLASDIAFVGSWESYHVEWTHRMQLVKWLRRNYGDRCRFWPPKGQPSVRGGQLRDIYASTKVNVGDSCLAGNVSHYWSDRIPETLGRGGVLVHPYVEGMEPLFNCERDLVCWDLGDFDELRDRIDTLLDDEAERLFRSEEGRRRVLTQHTYEVRMSQLLETMRYRGML